MCHNVKPPITLAFYFDGEDDYITTPTEALDYPVFTAIAWVRFRYTSPPPGWAGIIDKGRNGLKGWWLLTAKNSWRVVCGIGDGSTIREIYFGDMSDRNFHLIAIQYDDDSKLLRCWQDTNKWENTVDISIAPSGAPIEIGRRSNDSAYSFIGVGMLLYFNRFLSEQEMLDIFNIRRDIKDGLVLKLSTYGLVRGGGSKWLDESGNSLHGTVNGAIRVRCCHCNPTMKFGTATPI